MLITRISMHRTPVICTELSLHCRTQSYRVRMNSAPSADLTTSLGVSEKQLSHGQCARQRSV